MSVSSPVSANAQGLRLREVSPDDIPLLHAACWPETEPATTKARVENVLTWRRRGRALGIVASWDGHPVGFGMLTYWNERGEISDLIVSGAWRGRGIGTAMILYLLQLAQRQYLSVVEIGATEDNQRALALYRRLGFTDQYRIELDLGRGLEQVIYLARSVQEADSE